MHSIYSLKQLKYLLIFGLGLVLLTTINYKAIAQRHFVSANAPAKLSAQHHFVSANAPAKLFAHNHIGSVSYQFYPQNNSTVRIVTIPYNSVRLVQTRTADSLQPLTEFIAKDKPVAAINGGYFDPVNQKTTSYIWQDNNLIANPRINERLIDNPDLKPYLGKILNRSEFRRYQCRRQVRYDITPRNAPVPDDCILQDALGAGPQILPLNTSVAEGFTAFENNQLIRNAIGEDSPNARSAVAITNRGDVILAMVEQTSPNSGMSLTELADFLAGLGATKVLNLDGGSSTSLYYQDSFYYGKLDGEEQKVIRPLKSILLVK